MSEQFILEMRGINKRFPGVQALQDVDFEVRRGEVHALVGQNGAGKSTLLKILAGVYDTDTGEVLLNGRPIQDWSPHRVLEHGVSFIYQELSLIPSFTIAQNIMMGREPHRTGTVNWGAMRASAEQALARVMEERVDLNRPLKRLSVAKQQLVAIARALDQNPSLLVLDEPTSRLSLKDADHLFSLLRQMQDEGLSIIYVSHRLDEIYRIADRITVLRDGQRVMTDDKNTITPDELVRYMIGTDVQRAQPVEALEPGAELMRAEDLRGPGVETANLSLHSGEVVGLVGSVGAGKTELLRLLFGAEQRTGGSVWLEGNPLSGEHPRQAIERGVAFCPEDRKAQGLLLDSSVRQNVTLAGLRRFARGGWFPQPRREATAVQQLVERLRIATPSIGRHARTLSGGNQQKVVVAKWLCTESQVFLFDEPTVGVDVQGKAEIYKLMRDLAEQDAGVLFATSDAEESLQVCNRLLVMYQGRIVAALDVQETTLEEVMLYTMGGRPQDG